MATDDRSQNAREWFEAETPEITAGQMDLFGTAQSRSASPPTASTAQRGPKRSVGKRPPATKRSSAAGGNRPASTERPPSQGMSVAEVVQHKLRGTLDED